MLHRLRVQDPTTMTLENRVLDAKVTFERKKGFSPNEVIVNPRLLNGHEPGIIIHGCTLRTCALTDADTAVALANMGAAHIECPVTEFVVDQERKLVSSPAYMLAQSISEAAEGIEKTVKALIDMA